MSFLPSFTLRSRKKNIHQKFQRKANADELAQGATLLQAKKFMTKQVGKNYKLMEAFTGGIIDDPVYTNNEVPSMPGPGYTGPMSEIQSPVTDNNQEEMDELISMENEFQQTLSQWGKLHQGTVGSIMNLPQTYKSCLDACEKSIPNALASDVDMINACKYGCNIGKYSAEDNTTRKKSGNIPTPVAEFNPNASPETLAAGPLYQAFLTQIEAAGQVDPTMSQSTLLGLWKEFYTKTCSDAIGTDPAGSSIGASGKLSKDKRQRYCSGWQETLGGTSGYLVSAPLGNFIPMGSAADCDTPIEVGHLANNAGNSGYCVCADGRKVGYSDAGHPAFTCNDLCAPQNKGAMGIRSDGGVMPASPLYSNPENWNKKKDCPKTCPAIEKHWDKDKQISHCENTSHGCCKFHDHAITNTCDKNSTTYCEGYCPTKPAADSQEAALIDYTTAPNIIPLPTTEQLLQKCEDQMAAFAPKGGSNISLYSAILSLGHLEKQMEQQAEAIYAKIKSSNTTRNQIALSRTSAGQSLLKHLDTYEQIYRRLHATGQKQLNMVAMAENAKLKIGSANITYIIWFILAISSMFLVIKHLRK